MPVNQNTGKNWKSGELGFLALSDFFERCQMSVGLTQDVTRFRAFPSVGIRLEITTALDLTTYPTIEQNACYEEGFTVVCFLRFSKYSKISSFVILANFSLNSSLR